LIFRGLQNMASPFSFTGAQFRCTLYTFRRIIIIKILKYNLTFIIEFLIFVNCCKKKFKIKTTKAGSTPVRSTRCNIIFGAVV